MTETVIIPRKSGLKQRDITFLEFDQLRRYSDKVIIRIHFVFPDGTFDQNSGTIITALPSLSPGRF